MINLSFDLSPFSDKIAAFDGLDLVVECFPLSVFLFI